MSNRLTKYATLSQMQDMEFGVTGIQRRINEQLYELLQVGELYGWAAVYEDDNGNPVDWDRVSEVEARELGLIK
jgi:hypothetical protein